MLASTVRRARTITASSIETVPRLRIHNWFSTKTDAENAMEKRLESELEATHVKVVDVSGGCGSMYQIEIVSPRFVGQTRVKQHRMVNEVGQRAKYLNRF